MKFFVAAILLSTCLVAQGRSSSLEFDKLYNAIKSKNEGRIISGEEAALGQFPYQAVILMTPNGASQPSNLCGGTLINKNFILTAAHCVVGYEKWLIKLGGVRLDRPEQTQVLMESVVAIAHENYNPVLTHNDIALIQLPASVEYTDYIKPLRLPSRSEAALDLTDASVRVSGWGKTSDAGEASSGLMFVDLFAISNNECRQTFGSYIISSNLCAKGHREHSSCEGDSGGPLTRIAEDGQRTHIGLVSFGSKGGCTLGLPSVYSRTTSYLDWINQNTGIEIRP